MALAATSSRAAGHCVTAATLRHPPSCRPLLPLGFRWRWRRTRTRCSRILSGSGTGPAGALGAGPSRNDASEPLRRSTGGGGSKRPSGAVTDLRCPAARASRAHSENLGSEGGAAYFNAKLKFSDEDKKFILRFSIFIELPTGGGLYIDAERSKYAVVR